MSNKFSFENNAAPTVGLALFMAVNPVLSANNTTVAMGINQGHSSAYVISAQVSTTSSPYLMSQSSQSVQFESFIKDFFSNLSKQQESLGSDFASVLYDNLWDLYQS
jgi:hypothetical protein